MSKRHFLGLLGTLAISACGSGDVEITLQTSLPAQTRSFDLARTLVPPGPGSNLLVQNLAGPACRQADLRAGFRAQGGETRWFPVELDTEILNYHTTALSNNAGEATGRPASAAPNNTVSSASLGMSDYLGLKSALARPITIPVPKGIPGELFVMGTVYEPINQDHTGTQVNTAGTQCLRAMSGQIPLKSFAVYGSRPFLANEAGSTTLAINVLQHTKPAGYGVTPFAYSIPSPTVPINNTADLKCRDGMNPRTCANRGLFQIQFNLGVSHQILIRQPLPPHPQTFLTRLNLANGQTSPVMNSFIIPKESPLLISYINGTKTFDVVVQYFTKQLSFNFNGVRYTQILAQCPAANPVFYAGNVPEDGTQEPSLPLCGSGQHNFTIRDLGEGFN